MVLFRRHFVGLMQPQDANKSKLKYLIHTSITSNSVRAAMFAGLPERNVYGSLGRKEFPSCWFALPFADPRTKQNGFAKHVQKTMEAPSFIEEG